MYHIEFINMFTLKICNPNGWKIYMQSNYINLNYYALNIYLFIYCPVILIALRKDETEKSISILRFINSFNKP